MTDYSSDDDKFSVVASHFNIHTTIKGSCCLRHVSFSAGCVAITCNPASGRRDTADDLRSGPLPSRRLWRSGVRTKSGIDMNRLEESGRCSLSKKKRIGSEGKPSSQKLIFRIGQWWDRTCEQALLGNPIDTITPVFFFVVCMIEDFYIYYRFLTS